MLAQCFIYFELIVDSTVGVKNWIISIFFKQKAIISHVSPDILYLFRVQAVCRNEMRSDFSQTMLFQGKKPTYFYTMTICVFNIFFAECSMAWDDFRRCLNVCRHASDFVRALFLVMGVCAHLSAARVCHFLGEFRAFLKQIHQRLLMHQKNSYSRMSVWSVSVSCKEERRSLLPWQPHVETFRFYHAHNLSDFQNTHI